MDWYLVCRAPKLAVKIARFPFFVGRERKGVSSAAFADPAMSREQFSLSSILGRVYYQNKSPDNPAEVDGAIIREKTALAPGAHIVKVGCTVLGIGNNPDILDKIVGNATVERYMARAGGRNMGPWTAEQLLLACENGTVGRGTKVWYLHAPETEYRADEIIDFDDPPEESDKAQTKTWTTVDEGAHSRIGESVKCPYCRTVSDIGDLLAVSVSPSLLGDGVLGAEEQSRFAPTHFTVNGLAIDAEGGVCTDTACPRCHMSLPAGLADCEQLVMSVVGAAGAGKSVFLASGVWQCRKLFKKNFATGFADLAPSWNKWIRTYEEKLFFQSDDTKLQQIEKTDMMAANISRSVNLNGESVLLPTPSFFRLGGERRCLVVYDCAGEHFMPGADVHSSLVTLHTLSADSIMFLFDPSADPRLRDILRKGEGTAQNHAQMQDVLLAELAAKAKKHLGTKARGKLAQPLIFAVSKADLLRDAIPVEGGFYGRTDDGRTAIDVARLRETSRQIESFLEDRVGEVPAAARDISDNVWFVPVSALGHNPAKEGVRPCDIKPLNVELPFVMTLALKGMIPTIGGSLAPETSKERANVL